MYLAVRTDKEEAELIILKPDGEIINSKTWAARRELASSLLREIDILLHTLGAIKLAGIIFYKGPGSFTGLRIGAAVSGTLAYAKSLPIVSVSGDNWIDEGATKLNKGNNDGVVSIEYGSKPHITL